MLEKTAKDPYISLLLSYHTMPLLLQINELQNCIPGQAANFYKAHYNLQYKHLSRITCLLPTDKQYLLHADIQVNYTMQCQQYWHWCLDICMYMLGRAVGHQRSAGYSCNAISEKMQFSIAIIGE